MKRSMLFVVLAMLLSATLWSAWVNIPNADENLVNYVQLERSNISLDFSLDGYDAEQITESGYAYTRISYPEEGKILAIGMPDLPVFTRLIAVPDQGEVSLTVTSSDFETISNIIVYPQEELLTESEPIRDTYIRDEAYYSQGGIFPAQIAAVGEPAIMRDLRLVKVTFYPFRYDASKRELQVYHNISVEVITSGRGGVNTLENHKAPSRAFVNIYESSVLNYAEVAATRDEFQRPAILFIYPNNNDVATNLNYLVDWKDKKGFDVTAAHTGTTGTTTTSIKNYIQDAYDDWTNPPEFVVLVGDASGSIAIPSWTETWSWYSGIGDQPYSQLDGTDVLADVLLGRLSVNNISELQTMIAKSMNYEREPYMGNTDWFTNAVLVGDPSSSGPSTISTCKAVKTYIEFYDEEFTFDETYSGGWSAGLSSGINAGASYVCYRGYIGMSGWSTTSINALTNGWMLPLGSILTCSTGSFEGTAQSEVFAKAGTPTSPKGAIAAIGTATSGTHTCFNNSVTAGIFYGIFVDHIFNPGGALVRGKLNLYLQYPQNPSNYVNIFSHWNNLMGDPSVELWTGVPQPLTVFYDEEVALGTNYMQVVVLDEAGTPLKDAWVTARGDDFYQTGFTDINGIYYVDLVNVAIGEDYELTVTNHNNIPFEEEFTVIQADINLDIDQLILDDTNGDGLPNPGENIILDMIIANYGTNAATSVSADLESLSDYVTVTSAAADLNDIAAGANVSNSDLEISIDAATPGGIRSQLNLTLTADQDTWIVPIFLDIAGAMLNITEFHVADANGVIDPGETSEIYFSVENIGQITAMNVTGELECLNRRITIIDSLAEFGSIMPDDEVNNFSDRYQITASSAILPGTQIPVTIHFTNAAGYDNSACFLIEVGIVTQQDPLGPDAYGYYCYDDGDTDYDKCPEYDWVEINAIGDDTGLYYNDTYSDGADIDDFDFPADFTFVFYGEEYDMFTAATSGWISPGGSEVASFMNWAIPGPHGPSPIIAAFWDDLQNGSGGHVYTYYDATQHYYVVEWDHMQNEVSNAEQTFQMILYDPNFYPTTTGDSEIKFQYKVFNNDNSGSYRADHGQYCTIGLEDSSGTIGLQYTFNNTYPTAAKTLDDETAIFFTSPPIPPDGPFLTILDYSAYAGDDEYLEAGEEAVISISLENIGAETATDITVTITENDQYIEILDGSASCDMVAANAMIDLEDAFTISISENVPDAYTFILNVTIASAEDSWNQLIILTAYQANTFFIDPESISEEIIWGEQISTTFDLSNTGDVPVNFYIRTDETTTERDISGSFLECDATGFTPGETTTWTFSVYNGATDNEWVSDVWIDFPLGVTVTGASSFTGGSGGAMLWDGTTGQGADVNWHGQTANGWGVLHDGEIASAAVNVILSTEFAGDMTILYSVGGDGYGNDPHIVDGEIILEYPLRWINLDMSSGTLGVGDTQVITVNFDSSTIEEMVHTCNIVITSDSWDSKTIPVTLSPLPNNSDDTQLPEVTLLEQNYPNPFNPETVIPFSIKESSGQVTLKIYNMKGQIVKTLLNEPAYAGNYQIVWYGKDEAENTVTSGIYFSSLTVNGVTQTRKMILMK
ncbi:MAG: T9SS type A sorting domain-containing protein [Candidatus Cloacimonetes bacterium]|nr:T9SS type A sorting domain-containing protein [Candidatus Cloacimonadota bacterium]